MRRLRLLVAASVPPPYTGQEVLARTWIQSSLRRACVLLHVRTNVQTQVRSKGKVGVLSLLRFGASLLRLLTTLLFERPDVLLSYVTATRTGFLRDSLMALLARVCGVAVVWHYPGDVFRRFMNRSSPSMQRLIRWMFRRIGGVLVVSEGLRKEFETLLPWDRIHVLPNATVAPATLAERPRSASLRVVFLGWISYVKGFYDLVQALERLPEGTRFDFAGELIGRDMAVSFARRFLEGETLAGFERRAEEIQDVIEKVVSGRGRPEWRYRGVVDEVGKAALLSEADVLVIPSYAEGFPLVALEAMARSCAIIVSRAGALAEILTDGREGFIIDAGDSAAMADRLGRLASDPARCRSMGDAGRNLVCGSYDMDALVPLMERICRQSLRGRSPAETIGAAGANSRLRHR